ncbi:MAG: LPS assembly lipoprotein LptE [Lentimonas sp.]
MTARSTFLYGLSLLAIAFFSGCASYQLGTHGSLPFESIYIRPAVNESFAPQSQAMISAQIREAFIRDGRVKVLSKESEADAVLEVTLTEHERQAGARLRTDTESARTFRLELSAEISLFNVNSGDFYFEGRQLRQNTSVYADNPYATTATQAQGYIQAEYNAMTRIARGIARKIADEVLSPWPTHEEEAITLEAKKAETIESVAE